MKVFLVETAIDGKLEPVTNKVNKKAYEF